MSFAEGRKHVNLRRARPPLRQTKAASLHREQEGNPSLEGSNQIPHINELVSPKQSDPQLLDLQRKLAAITSDLAQSRKLIHEQDCAKKQTTLTLQQLEQECLSWSTASAEKDDMLTQLQREARGKDGIVGISI